MTKTKIFKAEARIRRGNLPSPLLWQGDVEKFLDALPQREVFDLVITSPPYNIGKPYEQPIELESYLAWQERVLEKALLRLKRSGSICWQVGNFVQKGSTGKESEILPLDILFYERFRRHGLKLRNRIIWYFGHGLHCKNRFSGRYEVVLWFTKSDDYHFDLDAVRVKPKYPGKKHFKGPRIGEYSCNPNGKNPEDVWVVSNAKSKHKENIEYPCQISVHQTRRLIRASAAPDGVFFDPFTAVKSNAA